jgi:hypothetical protein
MAGDVVAAGGGELASQDAGGDDRVAGAVAAGPGGVPGVADQRNPPVRPGVHVDLAGGVEVEVWRVRHLG